MIHRSLERLRSRAPTIAIVMAVLTCATLLVVGTWSSYWAANRNDQYQLIQLGQCLYDGRLLYVDCWENKPPGIAWINALGIVLSGGGQLAVWIMPGMAAAISLSVFAWAAAHWVGRTTAAVATVFAAALFAVRTFDSPSLNPDFYAACFELPAASLFVLAIRSAERGSIRAWLALGSGAAWGLAACVKQVGCVGLLAASAASIGLLVATSQGVRRCWLRAIALAWIGFLATIVVVGVILWRQGVFAEAWAAVVTFNRSLLNDGSIGAAVRSWSRVTSDLGPLVLPLWLAAAAFVLTLANRDARRDALPFALMMASWLVVAAAFALIGPSRSMRYWIAIFPPLLLLICVSIRGVVETIHATNAEPRMFLTIMLATIGFALGRPWFTEVQFGWASSYADRDKNPNERAQLASVANRVAELVPATESMYVWAYRPGIYVFAKRRPASRFTYPRTPAQLDEILSTLEARKPALFVMPIGSSPEFDRWCDESCAQKLINLRNSYVLAGVQDGYRLFIRPDLAPQGPPAPLEQRLDH